MSVVSWFSVNYATEGNPTKIPSKCLEKFFDFFSFFFHLLLFGNADKISNIDNIIESENWRVLLIININLLLSFNDHTNKIKTLVGKLHGYKKSEK